MVNAAWATVGGGYGNTASGQLATVGGGISNNAVAYGAIIGGGDGNSVYDTLGTVGGGWNNVVGTDDGDVGSSVGATVGGGYDNVASGQYSTVPGGNDNVASGWASLAAGNQARAQHDGTFVWADSNAGVFGSSGPDQFRVRCTGGAFFFSGISPSVGVSLPAGGNAWGPISDRSVKENFAPVDGGAVLERLASVPIETWNLKTQDPSIRHMGPMAQDFHAAFGLGEDDRHISTSNADGVALAAIQGLYGIVQEKDAEISELKARLAKLEALVERLVSQQSGGAK